jgi:magnesium-transporting ATPase (P-type)
MMTVIARGQDGKVWAFSKGAESSMFNRAKNKNDKLLADIYDMQSKGQRTIVFGFKEI